jgi:CHAT domain-containing protein
LAEEVRKGLLSAGGEFKEAAVMDEDSVTIEEAVEQEVEKEYASGPLESLAETLKKSLMNIKVEKPTSPMKTSISENLRESLLNLSTCDDAESKSESLDNWIIDDNQSEASIITLDTITDSMDMDMEDFDDFNDMEHELSMWITKE